VNGRNLGRNENEKELADDESQCQNEQEPPKRHWKNFTADSEKSSWLGFREGWAEFGLIFCLEENG